jgi:hypothetical protein
MDWGELIQRISTVLIDIFVPILVVGAVGFFRAQIAKIRSGLSESQWEFAKVLAGTLVMAAEQSGLAGILSNEGAAKRQWVEERLIAELEKRGIKIDVKMLSDLIEASVMENLNPPEVY